MTTRRDIDWTNTEAAAEALAGNWCDFDSFAWHRGYDLADAENWTIQYTHHRDSGLAGQSNAAEIAKGLAPFTEGDDPDVVFETHRHWACGHIDGYSLRVYRADGSITEAFEEHCRIQEELEDALVLNESDYSDREYAATLENYRGEMWFWLNQLQEGWESEVYSWFSDNGHDKFIENRDDEGGWAPRENLLEALTALKLFPPSADQPIIVNRQAT